MKILILTTYYPPDTAIAAVRPYMFAKYLAGLGHEITVLRSGEIINNCEHYFDDVPAVRVISYLGENSAAEAFERGEWKQSENDGESRLSFLPERIRLPIARFYHWIMQSREAEQRIERRKANFQKQKEALDRLKREGCSFDVVFSTYGELENIFGGQYAAKIFDCKLIQDFRDAVAPSHSLRGKMLKKMMQVQIEAVGQADAVTAVSHGLMQYLYHSEEKNCPQMVLHNGYEPVDGIQSRCVDVSDSGLFTMCYTGQLYVGLSDFYPILAALKVLEDKKKIDLSNVRFHYAGPDFASLNDVAKSLQLNEILVDHGYVSRSEAARIQSSSDIFTVLSWNTAASQGILTGKFYEGIRAGKPILSIVSGDVPHSELDLLNETYHYGFCYESCREKEQFQQLCDFLCDAYTQKMEKGYIEYHPNPALFTDFRYDVLATKLSNLCVKLVKE